MRGMGLVQFRAKKETILELNKKGYSKKLIYLELKEHLSISYSQFTRIWDKELSDRAHETKRVQISKSQQLQAKQKSNRDEKPIDPFRRQTRVIHDPKMTPERKKELFG